MSYNVKIDDEVKKFMKARRLMKSEEKRLLKTLGEWTKCIGSEALAAVLDKQPEFCNDKRVKTKTHVKKNCYRKELDHKNV